MSLDARFPSFGGTGTAFDAICGVDIREAVRMAATSQKVPRRVLQVDGPSFTEGLGDWLSAGQFAASVALACGDALAIRWTGVRLHQLLVPPWQPEDDCKEGDNATRTQVSPWWDAEAMLRSCADHPECTVVDASSLQAMPRSKA